MQSLWRDEDALAAIERYARQGVGEDLALRTYTARLLGGDPRLVLHGGGNTSVKTRARDVFGENVEVLCVKGSGWDLGEIEPAGHPAVRLQPLMKLRALNRLSDEDMVSAQRQLLLDPAAPNPSVETLLHAFIPDKFVDHTHSTAILALANQPDAETIFREIFGDHVVLVPYVMPGFELARAAGSSSSWRCADTMSSSERLFRARSFIKGCRRTAGWPAGSMAPRSQPEPLTQSTSTFSPNTSRARVFTEVLPPPCSTSRGSPPNSRAV